MRRLATLLTISAGLTGLLFCVTNPIYANSNTQTPVAKLSASMDPDGDNDAKGHNYFPKTRPATGKKYFIFDPNYHAWAVYDANGNRVNTGNGSGGRSYCPDLKRSCKTAVGHFTVVSKGGAGCISGRFPLKTHGGAKMPYCMHFGTKGYAVHGSYELPKDSNMSHGCIRVSPTAAKWLSQNFMTVGTEVIVLPYRGK